MKFRWLPKILSVGREVSRPPEPPAAQYPQDLSEFSRRLGTIETTLERVWRDLDFVRSRMSCYIGDETTLTYLVDEMPMFVNSNDFGSPVNIMNGGRYEEDNLEVLLSFVTPDTIFIDIGANVGFYAMQIGRRLTGEGKVYAFEPHPKLAELLQRNAYVNGLLRVVKCFPFALSDRNAPTNMQYPVGHLGGGRVAAVGDLLGHTPVKSEIKRLDDVLGSDFSCDLVKIDVEGHEINVLNGMRGIVANSPRIKILFEKLVPHMGVEQSLEKYFREIGFVLYGVQSDASLLELDPGGLSNWGGYALAARRGVIDDGMDRSRFSIFAKQFWLTANIETSPRTDKLRCSASGGELMFHGPYWFLKRGRWRLKFHGHIKGAVEFSILERFGYNVLRFTLEAGESEHLFTLHRDLVHFECAVWAVSVKAEIEVCRIEFIRAD